MESFAIRPMEARDLGAVVAMVRALSDHHGDHPRLTEATLARDALGDDPWVRVHVAEAAGRLIGYMVLTRLAWLHYGDRGMEIYHLFVAPDWRRRGIGQALIERAKHIALAEGCVELKVGSHPDNAAAGDYYLQLGFERQKIAGGRYRYLL